jgi:hypothetical protein
MGKVKVEGWWMQDAWGHKNPKFGKPATRMVILYRSPRLQSSPLPDARVTANLDETIIGTDTMRLVFNTVLTVDVAANDDELRKAFMELVTQSARTVYGPAAMLAKSRPTIKITETSRDGMVDVDLFDELPNG